MSKSYAIIFSLKVKQHLSKLSLSFTIAMPLCSFECVVVITNEDNFNLLSTLPSMSAYFTPGFEA